MLACAGSLALAAAGFAGVTVPWWSIALALSTVLTITGVGVALQGSGVFARPVMAGPSDRPLVALTFDDGPDPSETRRVLDLLDGSGHRATFFLIGQRASEHAELTAEIVGRGHALGNHSDQHSHATPFLAPARLASELARAQDRMHAASGARPRWFRPPVGLLSPRVVDGARLAGLELIAWTATARDGTARATVESSLARLEVALFPGAILVLHDAAERGARRPIAADVLRPLLERMASRGLRSVTLDELLDGDSLKDQSPVK